MLWLACFLRYFIATLYNRNSRHTYTVTPHTHTHTRKYQGQIYYYTPLTVCTLCVFITNSKVLKLDWNTFILCVCVVCTNSYLPINTLTAKKHASHGMNLMNLKVVWMIVVSLNLFRYFLAIPILLTFLMFLSLLVALVCRLNTCVDSIQFFFPVPWIVSPMFDYSTRAQLSWDQLPCTRPRGGTKLLTFGGFCCCRINSEANFVIDHCYARFFVYC